MIQKGDKALADLFTSAWWNGATAQLNAGGGIPRPNPLYIAGCIAEARKVLK